MMEAAGRSGAVHVLRLLPGDDVRNCIRQWAVQKDLKAGLVVSAVGSLSRAMIRTAGREEGTLLTDDLEVCGLSGTLSQHGLHLHVTLADVQGRMHGGHLLEGCLVRTTLELAVMEVNGVVLQRTHDPRTGHLELAPLPDPS